MDDLHSDRFVPTRQEMYYRGELEKHRMDMESLRKEIEEGDETMMKQRRDINDLKNSNDGLNSEIARLQKAKRRLQDEIDTLNAIFDQEKRDLADMEQKLKKQSKILGDERKRRNDADETSRDAQRAVKNLQIKIEGISNEKKDLDRIASGLENDRKILTAKVDEVSEARDNARRNFANMEKDKKYAEGLLNEANALIHELEGQLHSAESNMVNLQTSLNSSKERFTSEMEKKDEKLDTARRAADSLERDMKSLQEDEKKKRDQMNAARKGLESKIETLHIEIEAGNRRNEEQQKTIRKLQGQMAQFKELQTELIEMNEVKDTLIRELKDMEKRVKMMEHDTNALEDKLQISDRARRAAEDEAQEMQSESEAVKTAVRAAAAEEKRLLESKLAEVTNDLNLELSTSGDLEAKSKKLMKDLESAGDELANGNEEIKNLNLAKERLETKNRALESKVDQLDSTLKIKIKENVDTMTSRIQQLEITLDGEVKEREQLAKQLRKAEKQLSEASNSLLEAQENEESFKSQLDKMTKKHSDLKRENTLQLDDLNRVTHLKTALEQDLEEKTDLYDQLKKDADRMKASSFSAQASRSRSRMERNFDEEELED